MQENMRSREPSNIPFSNLFAFNPTNFSNYRDWLLEETKQHSFVVVIFFRGAWCPFCTRYQKSWNKYMGPVLKRDGLILAVSSQSQSSATKTVAKWKLAHPVIGDPRNELAEMFGVEVDPNPQYKYGMAQPAIVAFSKTGEIVYFWKSSSTVANVFGSVYVPTMPACCLHPTHASAPCRDRPRPYSVLSAVVKGLKRPSGSSGSSYDEEITSMYRCCLAWLAQSNLTLASQSNPPSSQRIPPTRSPQAQSLLLTTTSETDRECSEKWRPRGMIVHRQYFSISHKYKTLMWINLRLVQS
jgi:peroxiredoxin